MEKLRQFTRGQSWRFIMGHWSVSIFCLSLLVRLATIGAEPYWYDEAFTSFAASLDFRSMLQAIAGDTHPPIWYALSWLLTTITGSAGPVVLRLPAAIFSAASATQLYQLCKSRIGRDAGLIASGLFAILPGQIYYGQEARMYSLLTLLVLFVANSIHAGKWFRVALGAVLMLYTHNMSVLYAAPLGIWSLVASKGRILKHWYLGLAYLPWAGVLFQQFSAMQSTGFWIVNDSAGGALYYLEYTTLFNRLPAWAHWHGALSAIAVTVMALWSLRRELMSKIGMIAVLGIAPPVELYAMGQIWRPMMLERLLLPAGACVLGVWAAGWLKMSTLSRRVSLAILAPVTLLSIITYYAPGFRSDYSPATDLVRDNWQEGDTVYHNSLSSVVLLRGMMPSDGYILPGVGDLSQSLSEQTKTAMGIAQREMMPGEIAALGYRRLWVLRLTTPMTTQREIDSIDKIIGTYPIIAKYPIGHDHFVTFDIVLLRIDKVLYNDTINKNLFPMPSSCPKCRGH